MGTFSELVRLTQAVKSSVPIMNKKRRMWINHVKFTELVCIGVLKFEKDIFSVTEATFEAMALEVFRFQYQHNTVYRQWCEALKINQADISSLHAIPFLPIELFRHHQVVCGGVVEDTVCFTSSSTTSQTPSRHFVREVQLYEYSFMKAFENVYGPLQERVILALLPGYLERQGSSLVYMFQHLINRAAAGSGFYLHNQEDLINALEAFKAKGQKTLLIGVSYALMDLAESGVAPGANCVVMETGGMKGKRKELLKSELHGYLKEKLQVKEIHSEYGMTELLSQAYSTGDELFDAPAWMKFLIREIDDPFSYKSDGRTGGVNVIDLANLYSCSFIATQDLGRLHGTRLELMGRFDESDIRGCNLLLEE